MTRKRWWKRAERRRGIGGLDKHRVRGRAISALLFQTTFSCLRSDRAIASFAPIQAHGIAVTIRAIGYQCGPNSGPRFQVTTAPMVQTHNHMNHMSRARPHGWTEACRAMM